MRHICKLLLITFAASLLLTGCAVYTFHATPEGDVSEVTFKDLGLEPYPKQRFVIFLEPKNCRESRIVPKDKLNTGPDVSLKFAANKAVTIRWQNSNQWKGREHSWCDMYFTFTPLLGANYSISATRSGSGSSECSVSILKWVNGEESEMTEREQPITRKYTYPNGIGGPMCEELDIFGGAPGGPATQN